MTHVLKKSLKGTVWMTVSRMLGYVLSAISMIFIARWLGPSQYGYLALVTSIIQIVMVFGDMGLSSSTAYHLSKNRQDPACLKDILFKASRLLLMSISICSIIFVLMNPFISTLLKAPLLNTKTIAVLMCMILVIQIFSKWIFKVYEGLGETAFLSKFEISLSWLTPTISLLLVFLGLGVAGVFSAQFFGSAVLIIVLICALRKTASCKDLIPKFSIAPKVAYLAIISYAMPLMMIYACSLIYLRNSILILKFFGSMKEVSYYGLVMQIVVLSQTPALSFGASVVPQIEIIKIHSKEHAAEVVSLSIRYITIIYAMIALFLNIFGSSVITVLFSSEYLPSAPILQIFTPYILFFGISGFVSLGLDYAGKAKLRMILIAIAAISSVILNLYLVPKYGAFGAAWTNLLTYVPLVCTYIYLMAKFYGLSLKYLPLFMLKFTVSLSAYALTLLLIKKYSPGETFQLLAGFVIGTCVYLTMLFATRAVKFNEIKRAYSVVSGK